MTITSAVTPHKMYAGRLAVQLPQNLLAPFVYISEAAISHPEIAAFPTYYLAAWAGNEAALKKVLEAVFVAHYAGTKHAKTKDELAISNAIIFLGNKLAETIERNGLPTYEDAEKPADTLLKGEASVVAAAKPASPASSRAQKPIPAKTAAAAKADHKRPKPVIDQNLKWTKPGKMASEGN